MSKTATAPARSAGRRNRSPESRNPKTDPDRSDNRVKDPEEWVTGHEPMTGAQASYLKTLSEQAHDPKAYDSHLDKAEASKRIDHLKQERGR